MTAPKISILPAAPSRSNPTAFAAESDAFVAAQANFVTQSNNLATYVEVQANTVAPSLSYAEQAQAAAALALIYKNDAAAAVTYQDLSAIALSKAITMVDGDVYRTANDSDGGLWREQTQGAAWYKETLDTSTRGSTRGFPSVAIPMAESSTLTIYNADDPAAPMWKVLDFTGFTITSLAVVNGTITVGTSTGVVVLDFANDEIDVVLKYTTATTPAIVNNSVANVAMIVQHNAPVDPATGLQIPTIYVATADGISVRNNDETIADSSFSANFYNLDIYNGILSSSRTSSGSLLFKADLSGILADGFDLAGLTYKRFSDGSAYPEKSVLGTADNSSQSAGNAYSSSLGLTLFAKQESLSPLDAVAFVTTNYNSGYQWGDIKGAFLSSTAITSLVNGNTDDDRSVNANGLTVTGTINRDPVATGADLVCYSGWGVSAYMGQAYNTGLDFAAGNLSIGLWHKQTTASNGTILEWGLGDGGSTSLFKLRVSSAKVFFSAQTSSGVGSQVSEAVRSDDSLWHFYVLTKADGLLSVYKDGAFSDSVSFSGTLVGTGAETLTVGINAALDNPMRDTSALALLRISATAPSAEQIAKTYHDERPLFQVGAQSTIYGASDAVTAIAHDKGTNLLHVGTNAGRSVFSGLQRVSNTVVAVPGVISASNDLVIEG
jgi:hypothetical protein